jgi:GAF domain-containing protein
MTMLGGRRRVDVNEQLSVLRRLGESVAAAAEPDAIYREAIDALEQGLGATRSAVLLLDHEGVMRFRAWNRLSDAYRAAVEGHTPWAPGDPDPRPIFVTDVREEPTLAALRDVILREGIAALAFIPLTYGGRLLGKFMVYFDEPQEFAPLDAVVAETVASDVGFALGRREIEDQLRESRDQLQVILGGVADGISVQDPAGRLLYVNEAAAELVGFASAEEFMRTPLADVLARFEVLDEAGRPLPIADLPGRRALLGERVEGVTLGYRVVETGEERWSLVSAAPVFDAEGRVRFSINIFRDVTDRRRAEHALRFLADAGEVLGSSLDLESTLSTFTGLIVPALADWCIVDVLEPDGSIRQLAVAHHDPERVELVRELRRRFPPNWAMPHPITRVLATGRPELASRLSAADLPITDPDPANLELLERLGLASHLVVPMIAKGRTLGALSLVRGDSGRNFDSADLPLAAELAARAAVAVENARLFHDASEAAGILRFQKSLLQAQNEASAEGILVTTLDREIVSINSRYRDVWSVPDEVVETRRHDRMLEMAAPQARDPEGFLRRVDELYANPEDEALDIIELRDGRVFERLTRPISGEGTFYGRIWFYRDVTETKRAEAAQRFLSEATETLNASLDFGSTLDRVAHLAVPAMADASLVYLRSPDGEIRRVAAVHPGADALLEHLPRFALDPDAPSGVPHVLRTGQPELRSDTDARGIASDVFEADRLAELLEPYGLRSWMCVPMPIGAEAVGAIAFASANRRYDEEDLALAVELARRAGIAVHNARL